MAQKMCYQTDCTNELRMVADPVELDIFDDFIKGSQYQQPVEDGIIKDGDPVLMIAANGAQLYEDKQSDCWIVAMVILDISPAEHYKKKYVVPITVILGPNKPQNLDSFLFPYHLTAIQREGLVLFNGLTHDLRTCSPFL
ncbi:hypothetical protein CONPUDRAFT_148396 [Coniophora puteana RWD-64-598 SS2]|uniref:Uncharacterized protein n=1 Tax=Coniophora puteana (strain RWD-64-598) TaxID=741705 RepID=A0A5M3N618_CONPW|nr:uncharacterized protein CONPUDRAFT_148396 [Coniophora puteana RWD-64-598 SS2]EIW86301.1 hypothetical protein CONPUDRAFT_148396 [Coniophora puteana RWD-64-598 SS2]